MKSTTKRIGLILGMALLLTGCIKTAQKEDDLDATDQMLSDYEKIDETINDVINADDYDSKQTEEKKDILMEKLSELEKDGVIVEDSIQYQEDNEMIWYQWGDGYQAGIMLTEEEEGCSGGYAVEDKFVTEWGTGDYSDCVNHINKIIDYDDPEYPFLEQDIIDLHLSAKYMFGLCDTAEKKDNKSYCEILDNQEAWNENHLTTEIDDDCTVEDFKTGLKGYNIVIIEEHGNFNYKDTPMICTRERVTDENLRTYATDLGSKLVAHVTDTHGDNCYWLYPSFFEHYYSSGQLDDTIVWLGSCYGYRNDDLVSAFTKCGAIAVIGFDRSVYTDYDRFLHTAFVHGLMCGDNASDALYFAKRLFKYTDIDYYAAYANTTFFDATLISVISRHSLFPASASIYGKGESARLINLVNKQEQGERSIQLSVFAVDKDDYTPITSKDMELIVESDEIVCSNPVQTITSSDGAVIFDLTTNTDSKRISAKITCHIDGYKDFVIDDFVFGTDSSSTNETDAFFEKEAAPSQEDDQYDPWPDAYDAIPDDAYTWNGHSYYCYNQGMTWLDAEAFCEYHGCHLATLTSASENDAVFQWLQDSGYENAYFGLTDREEEGNFQWVTGENVSYTNWADGEPNGENSEEDYAMFYYKYDDGTWNDGDLEGNGTRNDELFFICEWDWTKSTLGETDDSDKQVLELYNTVYMGHYEQDGDTSSTEPIEWTPIDITDGKALLVSNYVLDNLQYDAAADGGAWINSDLRNWLNSTFLNTAFDADEQAVIVATEHAEEYNQWKKTTTVGCTDQIFVLSLDEFQKYYGYDTWNDTTGDGISQAAVIEPTTYAISKGISYDVFERRDYFYGSAGIVWTGAWWWLRSSGSDSSNVAIVDEHGSVYSYGGYVTDPNGVRPAVWVDVDAFESL